MFDWILPHEIILLWISTTILTGIGISALITELKNPLYIIANIFLCGFVGTVMGGIFVFLSDALIWETWSLLIPIFIGGITSYAMAIYLKDYIPKARIKVKPIAMLLAIAMIITLSLTTVITALPESNKLNVPYSDFKIYNVGETKILSLPNSNIYDINNRIGEIDLSRVISSVTTSSLDTTRLNINSYHTSIEFPSKMSEAAHEGDYISFKLTFSVPDNSPVNWQQPVWTIFCYAEGDDQMGLSAGDYILSEQFIKIPSQAGNIYTSSPCVYDANGDPMWAMYGVQTADGYMLLPITFAFWGINGTTTAWKDDSQYTFANTPEGWTPPYDQASWQISASNEIAPKESVNYWIPIDKGNSRPVYGKIYCPQGMANLSDVWFLIVIAYDYAYSTTSNVAYHGFSFEVQPAEAPIVNVSSEWWIEIALFGILTIIAIAAVRYGKEFI